MVELIVFALSALAVLGGACGVIVARNPVNSALSLVASLFGVAVLFVAQEAHFLAAVQVVVYAGAIVVLILFVLMLLGVDREEDVRAEPLAGQRPLAALLGAAVAIGTAALFLVPVLRDRSKTVGDDVVTGHRSVTEALVVDSGRSPGEGAGSNGGQTTRVPDIELIGRSLVRDRLLALELTAVLLTIAAVGAIWLARRGDDVGRPDLRPRTGALGVPVGSGDATEALDIRGGDAK